MTKFFLAAWHLVYHLGNNQQRQNALELDYYFSCHCEFVKSGIIVYSNECGFFYSYLLKTWQCYFMVII